MNLKLYGICFKMRGGPDLLDYVQTGTPVPVDVMEQVMSQMGLITQSEMAFAEKLDTDWKKAFNERVPLLMETKQDGGYNITCDVPEELLNTVHVLTELDNEKIVEEYVSSHLRDICGIETTIISVDVEQPEIIPARAAAPQASGFDLSDLGAVPDAPVFEDVSEFGGLEADEAPTEVPVEEPVHNAPMEPVYDVPAEPESEEPEPDEPEPEEPEPEEPEPEDAEEPYEEAVPIEEGYPEEDGAFPPEEDDGYPDEGAEDFEDEEEPEEDVPESEQSKEDTYAAAVTKIYQDVVTNIRDRKLDERLNLRIGE